MKLIRVNHDQYSLRLPDSRYTLKRRKERPKIIVVNDTGWTARQEQDELVRLLV